MVFAPNRARHQSGKRFARQSPVRLRAFDNENILVYSSQKTRPTPMNLARCHESQGHPSFFLLSCLPHTFPEVVTALRLCGAAHSAYSSTDTEPGKPACNLPASDDFVDNGRVVNLARIELFELHGSEGDGSRESTLVQKLGGASTCLRSGGRLGAAVEPRR